MNLFHFCKAKIWFLFLGGQEDQTRGSKTEDCWVFGVSGVWVLMKISLGSAVEEQIIMDENQDSSLSASSSDVCSDDLSSDSDLFGDEEEEEEEQQQEEEDSLSPSSGSSHGDEPLQDMSTLLQELPFK